MKQKFLKLFSGVIFLTLALTGCNESETINKPIEETLPVAEKNEQTPVSNIESSKIKKIDENNTESNPTTINNTETKPVVNNSKQLEEEKINLEEELDNLISETNSLELDDINDITLE